MEAVVRELTGLDLEAGIKVFSQASLADGAREWILDDIRAPAPYRLYQASATGHWVLDREGHPDRRVQVTL
jgi:hypothetical protein